MAADTQHWDVGSYVLGVLDPADIEPFEAHLATCDSCAEQVASLLPVVGLLPTADAQTLLVERAQPRSWGPTRASVVALTRRDRSAPRHGVPGRAAGRQGKLAVAASILTAVVAGGSFAAGTQFASSDPPTAQGSDAPRVNGGLTANDTGAAGAQRYQATDPGTGANAQLAVTTTAWGSQLELSLGGVRGPLRCELLAIGADGSSTVVASWLVADAGYGVVEQPNRLRIQAATAVSLSATSHFEIRATSPQGRTSTLVSIPA